jgi:hypothetical protein
VQDAIRDGVFVGVVSGLDRSLQVEADLSNAIKRSAKVWIEAPTFQVVSGAVSLPDRRSPRSLSIREGIALEPDLYSTCPGLAVLRLSSERVDVILHHFRGGWRTGTVSFPLRRPPHPAETPSPSMAPCRDCPEVPVGETTR